MKMGTIFWIIRGKRLNLRICRKSLPAPTDAFATPVPALTSSRFLNSKVTLQESTDEKIHLRNLSALPALTESEALNHLFVGDTNRMIAETPSNPASSRSHCLFIVTVRARSGEGRVRVGKLFLVDLAG